MLMADCETINMNGDWDNNFIASIWRWSTISHVVWRQTCFYSFPLCPSVLEPNFNLREKKSSKEKFLSTSTAQLTWTSLSFNVVAIWLLSVKLKYFFAWNSLSSSSSCSLVKAVLRLRDLADFGPSPDEFSRLSSSSSPVSFSLSEHSESELHNSAGHDIE